MELSLLTFCVILRFPLICTFILCCFYSCCILLYMYMVILTCLDLTFIERYDSMSEYLSIMPDDVPCLKRGKLFCSLLF